MRERRNFNEEQPTYLSENKIFIIFAAITFVLFIALALFSYNSFIKGQESGEVVLIKSDEQPYKVTPEDPGGMKVNYQDKEVFNTLIGKETPENAPSETAHNVDEPTTPLSPEDVLRKEAAAENLAADNKAEATSAENTEGDVEKDIPSQQAAEAITTGTKKTAAEVAEAKEGAENMLNNAPLDDAAKNEATDTEGEEASPKNVAINNGVIKIGEVKDKTADAKVAAKTSTENTLAKVEAAKDKLVTDSKKEVAKTPVKTTTKAKETAAKESKAKADAATAKNGKFFVQLSAYSSTHSLDKGWNDLKAKYGKAINGSKQVNKISRDGKTLYRLSFGPYKQKIAAVEACNKLKAKGQDCIVREM